MQTGKIPVEVDFKDPISLLLAGSAFWKETVFDRAADGISRMKVDMHCFYHSQHLGYYS
jgi:hypothetical protein